MLSLPQLDLLASEFVSESWVNPFMGFNRGYRLEPSVNRAAKRGAKIYDVSVKLPHKLDSSIYLLPVGTISWISDMEILQDWISLVDYCNATGTLFTITNPRDGSILGLGDCYIAMVSGRYPVLITPFQNGVVDVNIRKSMPSSQFSARRHQIVDVLDLAKVIAELDSIDGVKSHYRDGRYIEVQSLNELSLPVDLTTIINPTCRYLVDAKITSLDTYRKNGDTFFAVDLGTEAQTIYHYLNCEFTLFDTATKTGIPLDKSSKPEMIHQVTNKIIGFNTDYIERLCTLAGISTEFAVIKIHVSRSPWKYMDNYGMNGIIENITEISPSALVTNGDPRLEFVSAGKLVDSPFVKLQTFDFGNSSLTADMFPQEIIDNRLMSLQASIGDDRISTRLLSGKPFNKYSAKLKYSKANADLDDYIYPAIFTYDHKPAVFGTDYYVSDKNEITLLQGAYVVDRNGRYETSTERPFEIIELSEIPLYTHPDMCLEVSSGGVFLHPGVDYLRMSKGIIVWKEGVRKIDIAMYLSSYHRSETSWVFNTHIVIPQADVRGMGARINVFAGDECLTTNHVIPAKNGTPYTVTYELLDLFNRNEDLTEVHRSRAEYDSAIESMRDYFTPHDDDHEVTGFRDFYYLVSPFCIDVLKAIRNREIDPSPHNIATKGIRDCIPTELLKRLDMGYDPSSSRLAQGSQFVIIKGHDEKDLMDLSPDEWNFLRHVNGTLLGGKIMMELYFRIKL